MEENHLFPKLEGEHELVKEAKRQHRELKSLFEIQSKKYDDFKAISKLLKKHIRFEE